MHKEPRNILNRYLIDPSHSHVRYSDKKKINKIEYIKILLDEYKENDIIRMELEELLLVEI
ncbi:MAG: hypothetical protein H8D97_00310 [Proteobacteria bacterium]|nr:hypothetical protein [Pseudomonadota bacterium]